MTCLEEMVVRFLAGELSADEAHGFEAHLLSCEACWRAVQEDRAGRTAIEHLREPAPAGLADRVAMAVRLASSETVLAAPPPLRLRGSVERARAGARRHRMSLVLAAACVAAAASIGGWLDTRTWGPAEPPQIAAVLALARSTAGRHPQGSHLLLVANGQRIAVRLFVIDYRTVVVATSFEPFPMPTRGFMPGSTPSDWMATTGHLGIYCVNRVAERTSMLVVAAMPVEELPHVAAELHLL